MPEKINLNALIQNAKAEEAEKELRKLKEFVRNLREQPRKYKVEVSGPGNSIRYGVCSDLHFGSKYARIDALVELFSIFRRERVKTILCAGDIFDGTHVYPGQEYEQSERGMDEQLARFTRVMDKIDAGLYIYFITGNHDASWSKTIGASAGLRIAELRKNWHFLGADSGSLVLQTRAGHKYKIALLHPAGSGAYALSYRLQKTVESLPGGQKPDALYMGHFHKLATIWAYRNVDANHAGTLQSQTPFMERFSSPAQVGGYIAEVTIGPRQNLTRRTKMETIEFFEPKDI